MLIRSGEVELRSFERSLSETLYGIRNHPSVRGGMRDSRPISRDSHDAWVYENLIAVERLKLFIVAASAVPVGLALLRNFSGDSAEIGVMIVDAGRRPLAAYKAVHLIGYYGFEVLDLERLFSYVPLHNAAALEFNLRCGLEPTGRVKEPGRELILTRERSRSHPTHRRFRRTYPIVVVA